MIFVAEYTSWNVCLHPFNLTECKKNSLTLQLTLLDGHLRGKHCRPCSVYIVCWLRLRMRIEFGDRFWSVYTSQRYKLELVLWCAGRLKILKIGSKSKFFCCWILNAVLNSWCKQFYSILIHQLEFTRHCFRWF